MRAPSFTAETALAQKRMEALPTRSCPENNGSCSRMFMPATSRGNSTRRTQRLQENAHANGQDRRKSLLREGLVLLQGLVVCGVCGSWMMARYHTRQTKIVPEYVCQRDGADHIISVCQHVFGEHVDQLSAGFSSTQSRPWRWK